MLSSLLKERTANLHNTLEDVMYATAIMTGKLTPVQYKHIIHVNYLAHCRLEPLVYGHLSVYEERLRLPFRHKLRALQKDTAFLSLNVENNQPVLKEPLIKTCTAALGTMYVLEGATLGGNVILKQLQKNPTFNGYPHHYYNIYGVQVGRMWQSFLDVLNTVVPQAEFELCINSAIAAFDLFKEMDRVANK